MMEIPIGKSGRVALVDDEDYPEVSKYSWRAIQSGNIFYAYAFGKKCDWPGSKRKSIAMHRLVLKVIDDKHVLVDHANHNGLDNRKENLRRCTRSQNGGNYKRCKTRKGATASSYKGVDCVGRNRDLYAARIRVNKKLLHLGRFKNITDAANAYDRAAKRYFKEFSSPNFSN